MDNRKWLKRKYPKSFNEISNFLDDKALIQFKDGKYKIGRLVMDNFAMIKGELMFFKRSNPVNDYNYPSHPAIFKCSKNHTVSGYHSEWITENYYEEIVK
jgi:hypothetical protein